MNNSPMCDENARRWSPALYVLLCVTLINTGCAQAGTSSARSEAATQSPSLLTTTNHFEFHSNFWLNLNHYVYKMAARDGRRAPIAPTQFEMVDALAPDEREVWDRAIEYYTVHHIEDNIRTDDTLYDFKRWVIDLPEDTSVVSDAFDPEWLDILNELAPIYREQFWPAHLAQNLETVEFHLPVIRRIEDSVFERLARLGRRDPPAERLRVDISYYSNWAGAYTTNRPVTHVVLSSVDIQPPPNWLEILFHETAHSMISGRSPVGQVIDSVAAANGREPESQLWHAMLFYFSGRAVQDELGKLGISHTLYMLDKNVFGRLYPSIFEYVEPYVRGEISLEEAVVGVSAALAER